MVVYRKTVEIRKESEKIIPLSDMSAGDCEFCKHIPKCGSRTKEKMMPISVIDAKMVELLEQRDKNELGSQTFTQTQMLNTMVHELEEIKKQAVQ